MKIVPLYCDLIEDVLMRREEDSDWWKTDPRYPAIRLAVRLARALSAKIREREGVEVGVDEILRLDCTACGHTDYVRRMAIGIQDLIGRPSSSPRGSPFTSGSPIWRRCSCPAQCSATSMGSSSAIWSG